MTAPDTGRQPDPPAKKPYEPPRLEVYGDVRELTNSHGYKGKNDHGRRPRNRTR